MCCGRMKGAALIRRPFCGTVCGYVFGWKRRWSSRALPRLLPIATNPLLRLARTNWSLIGPELWNGRTSPFSLKTFVPPSLLCHSFFPWIPQSLEASFLRNIFPLLYPTLYPYPLHKCYRKRLKTAMFEFPTSFRFNDGIKNFFFCFHYPFYAQLRRESH